MKAEKAKGQLVKMLDSLTLGSILHLLGDIYRDAEEEASRRNDQQLAEQCRMVAATLLVVGFGLDAAVPH